MPTTSPQTTQHARATLGNVAPSLSDVVVIIPALNESAALPLVLADLPSVGRVIVVDNGSTDGTGEVAIQCGASVVVEPQRGYGAACLRGLDAVKSLVANGQMKPAIIAFVDADYGDHPDRLQDIVAPILRGDGDFVLGSRLMGRREAGAMPAQAVWGNRLACFLMRLIWGVHYTDLGPMRAIRYSVLQRFSMQDRNFGWTVEMQIKAAQLKTPLVEIPVPYRKRVGKSKISGTVSGTVKAGYKILATIFRYGLLGNPTRRDNTKLAG